MGYVKLSESILQQTIDKIREKASTSDLISPAEMSAYIDSISGGEKEYEWVRPADFPNLDAVDLSEYEDAYLFTYDTENSPVDSQIINIQVNTSASSKTNGLKIDFGHIDGNQFIVDHSEIKNLSAVIRDLPVPDIGRRYIVIMLTASAGQPITQAGFIAYNRLSTQYSTTTWLVQAHPIVESRIKVKNFTTHNTGIKDVCYATEHIRIENITSQCTNISNFLSNAYSVKQIDFIDCDTQSVTSFSSLFSNCLQLRKITGYENFITSKVTSFNSTFNSCYSIDKIDVTKWDMQNATDVQSTFYSCRSLKYLDLSGKKFPKVTNANQFLRELNKLEEIDITGLEFGDSCTNVSYFLNNTYHLKRCIGSETFKIPSAVTSGVSYMFNNMFSITDLDLSGMDLTGKTYTSSGLGIGLGCHNLINFKIPSGISTSITLNTLYKVSMESLDYLADKLGVTANATLTLSAPIRARLTDDQINKITNKGWTIA